MKSRFFIKDVLAPLRRLLMKMTERDVVMLLSLVVGIACGLAAVTLKTLIEFIHHHLTSWFTDEAYNILKDIVIAKRCEYPEVSYGMVEGIISGTMGIEPSASKKRITTLPKITGDNYLQISNMPVLGGTINVRHNNNQCSALLNNTPEKITWEAAFVGEYENIAVNGESTKAMKRTDAMGQTISYVEVELSKGEKACCSVK